MMQLWELLSWFDIMLKDIFACSTQRRGIKPIALPSLGQPLHLLRSERCPLQVFLLADFGGVTRINHRHQSILSSLWLHLHPSLQGITRGGGVRSLKLVKLDLPLRPSTRKHKRWLLYLRIYTLVFGKQEHILSQDHIGIPELLCRMTSFHFQGIHANNFYQLWGSLLPNLWS